MHREFDIAPFLINHQSQPGKNAWVKIFIYEPADLETQQTRGTMYSVISLSAKPGVDFAPIMQLILEELHTQYFQQTSGGILQALEVALDSIHKKLILLGQQDKRLTDNFEFSLLTAVSWGTVLYFGQLGPSRAALYRDGKLFDIDEGEQKSATLYLSSGVLQSQDRVILGTSQLFKRFNRTELKQALSKSPDKIIPALESQLDPGPARSEQSGIILSIDIKQVPSIKEESLQIHDADRQAVGSNSVRRPRPSLGSFFAPIHSFIQNVKRFASFRVGKMPLVAILVVLVALIALAISLSGGEIWKPQFGPNQELINSATDKINQADEVAAVNPDRAQDLLGQAEEYIHQGLTQYPSNEQLNQLQQRYDTLIQQILVITQLQPIKLSEITLAPTQPRLIIYDNQIFAIDGQKEELISVALNGKASVVSSDQKFSQGALLTATNNGLVVVSQAQAYPVSENGSIGSAQPLPDSTQAAALTGFNQNGYLLDRVGQIYRLPNQDQTIGQTSRYFPRPLSGEEFTDIGVDGSVYLLRQDGSLDLYLNGEKQALSLERSQLANGSRALFVSPENGNIYLLHDHALLVWTKAGKYLGQYQFDNANKWQMAGIDEQSQTLYVLTADKLLKAKLPD